MNDVQLEKLFILLRRPIPWDPIPWWIKLDKDKIAKFYDVQARLNTKIAELEVEKIKEMFKITEMQ
jgi:hypothetical protein